MSLLPFFYEPSHDLFFDFNRILEVACDAHVPSASRELSRREESYTISRRPRMDLHESKETGEMTATFELPGMKKEDVDIDVHQNRLIVSGQSTVSDSSEKDGYSVRERRFGRFSRTVPLPTGIKPEDVKAKMENGVLTVTFPKSHPDQEPRKVVIS